MRRIFSPDSPYKKQAGFLAVAWTLFILAGCFTPGKDLPQVDVPFIDKWVHIVLFGGFTFLWLCVRPYLNARWLLSLLLMAIALGTIIELLQGLFTSLGRSMELMDAVADAVGGLVGILLFAGLAKITAKR